MSKGLWSGQQKAEANAARVGIEALATHWGKRDVEPLENRLPSPAFPVHGVDVLYEPLSLFTGQAQIHLAGRQHATCASNGKSFRYKRQGRLECQEEVTG